MPESLLNIDNSPFDVNFNIGDFYLKDQTITVIINISIKRFEYIEKKELKYNFKRKTTFGLFTSGL
jgi:hypothetical protein